MAQENIIIEPNTRNFRKLYKRFIGDKKYDYYMKKFDKVEHNHKNSFNIAALSLGSIWCFYRRLLVSGFVVLVYQLALILLSVRIPAFNNTFAQILLMILFFIPNVICGIKGTAWYNKYVKDCIKKANDLPSLQQEKFFKENADTSTRTAVAIGLVYIVAVLVSATAIV